MLDGGERALQHLLREPECRVCGCTSARGCPEGCIWVESDLCSRCARAANAAGPEAFTEAELEALAMDDGYPEYLARDPDDPDDDAAAYDRGFESDEGADG